MKNSYVSCTGKDRGYIRFQNSKMTFGTNYCDLGFRALDGNVLLIFSAIDNLIKGAAGQVVQNMNIMLDYSEDTGTGLSRNISLHSWV